MGKKLGHLPKIPVLTAKQLAKVIAAVTPDNTPQSLAVIASQSDTAMATLAESRRVHPDVVRIDKGAWSLTEHGLKLAR